MTENTDKDGSEPVPAVHISGAHLAFLLDVDPTDPVSSAVGEDLAKIIVDWQRDAIYHGRS